MLVALGCVQALHWVLFFESVRRGSVALAVITFASAPVVLAVLAPAFLPEQLSRVAVAALVPGLAGITLVVLWFSTGVFERRREEFAELV